MAGYQYELNRPCHQHPPTRGGAGLTVRVPIGALILTPTAVA
jgi:hypothetical protein